MYTIFIVSINHKYYKQKHKKTGYSIPTSVESGVLETLFSKVLDYIKFQINETHLKDCHSLHYKKTILKILKLKHGQQVLLKK